MQPKATKRRVPKSRRNRKRNVGNVDPFIACVYGPVDHPGEGEPCPDGSNCPTVVVEHRQTVVLTPRLVGSDSTGKISFALVSSPYGAVSLGDCHADVTLNRVDWYTCTGGTHIGGSGAQKCSGALKDGNWLYSSETRAFNADFGIYDPISKTNETYDPDTGLDTTLTTWYQTIPFAESLKQSTVEIDKVLESGLQATRFRVLTTLANVSFTGSSLDNGGVASTARVPVPYNDDKPIPYPGFGIVGAEGQIHLLAHPDGTEDENIIYNPQSEGRPYFSNGVEHTVPPPTSFGGVASLPGSRTFPARESTHLVNPPIDYEFQDLRKMWTPYYVIKSGAGEMLRIRDPEGGDNVYNTNNGVNYPSRALLFAGACHPYYADTEIYALGEGYVKRAEPIPGMGAAPVTYYFAQGLSSNASLTVTVRTCVEYQLAYSSPSARFAKMPPPERPLALRAVLDIGKKLPSSAPVTPQTENSGWLGNALSWYGNTMKNIIGTSWQVGANIARSFLPNTGGIAALVGATRNLSIGYSNRPAIMY